jgi:hypothetical protein
MLSSDNRKRRFKAATASTILAATIPAVLFSGWFDIFGIDELVGGTANRAAPATILAWSTRP